MPEDRTPMEFPLTLLDSPMEFVKWQTKVGGDEADRMMKEATLRYMEANGTRAVLDVGEKLEVCTARLAEFFSDSFEDFEEMLLGMVNGVKTEPNDPRNDPPPS